MLSTKRKILLAVPEEEFVSTMYIKKKFTESWTRIYAILTDLQYKNYVEKIEVMCGKGRVFIGWRRIKAEKEFGEDMNEEERV